jgi:hypothetical protein
LILLTLLTDIQESTMAGTPTTGVDGAIGSINQSGDDQLKIATAVQAAAAKGAAASGIIGAAQSRPASRGRLERARAHTIPKPPNGQSRKAGVGRTG